jgi:hypothetical protein
LTQDDVGDVSELVGLLDQVATAVASVIADGAYDGETVYHAVTHRHPEADIIIPPRATAVPGRSGATQRHQHIATIEKHGRIGWQKADVAASALPSLSENRKASSTESFRSVGILPGERQICWVLSAFSSSRAPTDDLTIRIASGQFVGKH